MDSNLPAQKPSKVIVFIDESGTLPDKDDGYLVMSAVVTKNPTDLIKISNKLRRKNSAKGKLQSEIKFYKSGRNTIINYLNYLKLIKCNIYILIINKSGRGVADTPQNYSILVKKLIEPVLKRYNRYQIELVLDRHFHNQSQQNLFNSFLASPSFGEKCSVRHVDSQRERAVNSADMVSGSYLAFRTKKNTEYFKLIKGNVAKIIRKKWTMLKRENLAEPV